MSKAFTKEPDGDEDEDLSLPHRPPFLFVDEIVSSNQEIVVKQLGPQLQRLPGIGAKSAQRLAFHVLKTPREDADRLCEAIQAVKERVTYCSTCNNITDVDPCVYCSSATRNQRLVCVVEEPTNTSTLSSPTNLRAFCTALTGSEPSSRTMYSMLTPAMLRGMRATALRSGMPSDAAGPVVEMVTPILICAAARPLSRARLVAFQSINQGVQSKGRRSPQLRTCSRSPEQQNQESQVDELQAGVEFSLAVFP